MGVFRAVCTARKLSKKVERSTRQATPGINQVFEQKVNRPALLLQKVPLVDREASFSPVLQVRSQELLLNAVSYVTIANAWIAV